MPPPSIFIPPSRTGFVSCVPLIITKTHAAATAEPTSCRTVEHAKPQTCMLTLPRGALGNDSIHSIYPGTNPRGNQNIACLANQNCRKNRRPLVRDQRRIVAPRSKVAREDCKVDASNTVNRLARIRYSIEFLLRQNGDVHSPSPTENPKTKKES